MAAKDNKVRGVLGRCVQDTGQCLLSLVADEILLRRKQSTSERGTMLSLP